MEPKRARDRIQSRLPMGALSLRIRLEDLEAEEFMDNRKCIKCRQTLGAEEVTCPRCHARTCSLMGIGQILVERGQMTPEKLEEVLTLQRITGKRLGSLLVDGGLLDEESFARTLAQQLDIPFFDLAEYFIDPAVVTLVPDHLCERHRLIPLMKTGERLLIAMADPTNTQALEDIDRLTGLKVKVALATESQVLDALAEAFGEVSRQSEMRERLWSQPDSPDPAVPPKLTVLRKPTP